MKANEAFHSLRPYTQIRKKSWNQDEFLILRGDTGNQVCRVKEVPYTEDDLIADLDDKESEWEYYKDSPKVVKEV